MKSTIIRPAEKLSADQKTQLFELVCNEFVSSSPIHDALGINSREFSDYMHDDWESYIHKGPLGSLVACEQDSGDIIGCMISADFPSCFNESVKQSLKQQTVSALLEELEELYLRENGETENSLLVDIAVVADKYSNQGIYQQLRHSLQGMAITKGFKSIFGELTSAATQHVCIDKLHQQTVAEVFYKDFKFAGTRPFANILEPPSIKLVKASLPSNLANRALTHE